MDRVKELKRQQGALLDRWVDASAQDRNSLVLQWIRLREQLEEEAPGAAVRKPASRPRREVLGHRA